MKQLKWSRPSLIILTVSALLLNACSYTFEVFSTPTPPPAIPTSIPPTDTAVPPTLVPPSATPTLISIKADTLNMLEIFKSFDSGEGARSLAFTPEGTTLAAAGGNTDDFTIHLWDVVSGQPIRTLDGHTGIVWDVTFSPDGQMLASVSSDGTAKVWDWRTGNILKVLDFPGQVASVRFSPDGQVLAVGGVDEPQNQIQNAAIWTFSVGSWNPLSTLSEYWNITTLTYSPDGRWLVGGGTSRNVQVWRTSDGASIFTLSHAHQVSSAAISPDSSTVATATCATTVNNECTEGVVWLWDLLTGKLIKKLAGFPDVVESVAFSVDGSFLIAASRSGTLRVFATSDYQPQLVATPPGGDGVLALSPDGGLLATGGANGKVYLWKIVYRP